MERISLLTLVLLAPIFSTFILALQHPSRDHDIDFETEGSKPVAFLLAGDSTTAKNGGWGDGFLTFVEKPAIGRNHGRGGATTVSFKKGGNWGNVVTDVKKYAAQYLVYVTIQFGHNDQKESAGISISDYKKNLAAFAREVKSAGGTPILVTPLTRRTFKGSKVVENLSEQRTATIAAATGGGYSYIDLNMASTKYINEIGQSKAMQYNLADKDYTHLNTRGSVLFGRMVANLLVDKFPDLERSLHNALTSPN